MKKKDEEDANAIIFYDLLLRLLHRRRSSPPVPERPSLRWSLLLLPRLLSSSSEQSHGARRANQRLDGLRSVLAKKEPCFATRILACGKARHFSQFRLVFAFLSLEIVAAFVVAALASFFKLFVALSITVSRTVSIIIGGRNDPMDSIYLCIKSSFSNKWSSIKCNVTSFKSNFCDIHFWDDAVFLSVSLLKNQLTLVFCLLYLVSLGLIVAQCSYSLLHLLCIIKFLILQFIFQW